MNSRWVAVSAVVAATVYAAAWIGWAAPWAWLLDADYAVLNAFHLVGEEHPWWVIGWNVLCTVFSPVAIRIVVIGGIVWAAVRRRWWLALYLVVGVELPGLVTVLAKALADRPRPETALVYASSTSFPSGHALGTTAAVLALLAVGLPLVRPRARRPLVVVGIVVILAVGVGRVVLNVHHPSDVVAGWALGYLWFVVTLPLLARDRPVTAEAGTPATRGS